MRISRSQATWQPTPWLQLGQPYNCYRTVEELYAYGAALASYYPHLAEWTDVGDSWEKALVSTDGYDMMLLRLTNEISPRLNRACC
jgi:hypothetical protein